LRYYHIICLKGLRKTTKTSDRIAGALAERKKGQTKGEEIKLVQNPLWPREVAIETRLS
jgi:hypothetical protein